MKAEKVDLLIIIPPVGAQSTVYPPFGSMYIASALRQRGYNPKILNVDTERIADDEVIKRVKETDPKYIGFSGIIATAYKYIKELSRKLRQAFPDKIQILGGGLSSAAEVLLRHTSVDIVVYGEGDITIVELLDCLEGKGDLRHIPGIYYKEGHSSVDTGKRPLIMKLDTLAYPAFELVDMDKYLPNGLEHIRNFMKRIEDKRICDKKRKRRMMTILTSRGCFNECAFCFRAYPGLRLHSIKYVLDFIEYCIDKFDVGFFTFGDECFAPNKKRNREFIEEYKRRKLDIVFRILGMRVDTVDPDILKAYKEIGCWMIEYGFESGSQKMLNIINKRVTVEQNRNVAKWTHEAGIYTSPAFVIGMPGETTETVRETIDFIKSIDIDFKQYQWKYAIPIPGSQLYNFAKLTRAIENEDEYLSSLTVEAGSGAFNINLTDQPDEVVAKWDRELKDDLDKHCFRKKYKIENRTITKLVTFFVLLERHLRRKTLLGAIGSRLRSLFFPARGINNKPLDRTKTARFKKKMNIKEFIEGIDHSFVNPEMSLRKINNKICEKSIKK